jgi:hypothetical protein
MPTLSPRPDVFPIGIDGGRQIVMPNSKTFCVLRLAKPGGHFRNVAELIEIDGPGHPLSWLEGAGVFLDDGRIGQLVQKLIQTAQPIGHMDAFQNVRGVRFQMLDEFPVFVDSLENAALIAFQGFFQPLFPEQLGDNLSHIGLSLMDFKKSKYSKTIH